MKLSIYIYYTSSTFQFGLTTLQVLENDLWLVAILWDGGDLESSEMLGFRVAQQFQLCLKPLFHINTFLNTKLLYPMSHDGVLTSEKEFP